MRRNEWRFDAGAVEINYLDERPAGPPLVLLHGLGARWQVFAPLVSALSDDWHLVVLDLRGHGRSGRAPGRYLLDDYAGDVSAFLRREVGAPAVLFGHSLGGWVALLIAARHPELARAVIVGDSARFAEQIDPTMAIDYLADLPLAMRGLSQAMDQADPDVLAAFRDGRLVASYEPEASLPRIACPVLLLQADPARGALMTDDDVARALPLLPQAEHAKLEGVGHGLHVENAEPVLAAVTSFLGGQPAEGTPSRSRAGRGAG